MRFVLIHFLLFSLLVTACNSGKEVEPTASVSQAESVSVSNSYYQEPHRPQLHFSPEEAWMNDPNGLVYNNGLYHLFYQHFPDSTVWGPMHWGHAISKDLVQWEHLPIALAPDEHGLIFSGSVVVDKDNTSGFGMTGANGELVAPMVAIFTYHLMEGEKAGRDDFQTQGIAYSTDGGFTWTKYANNPVIKNPGLKDFRDPKVIWHEGTQRWVMALAVLDHVQFYTSPDLKSWELASNFGKGLNIGGENGIWECPDLFPIREYLSSDIKYALIVSIQSGAPAGGSGTSYFVGDFDGKNFTPDGAAKWLDYGADNYAFVTYSNAPTPENRRLGIGWMSNWQYAQVVPTEKWRSAMTSARVLTLHKTVDGLLLKTALVPDLYKLRQRRLAFNRKSDLVSSQLFTSMLDWNSPVLDVEMATPDGIVSPFQFSLWSDGGDTISFGYDANKDTYFIDRTKIKSSFDERFAERHSAPRKQFAKAQNLRILIDRSSIEFIADDGFTVLTDTYFLRGNRAGLNLDGDAGLTGTIYELEAMLPTPESVARVRLGLD